MQQYTNDVIALLLEVAAAGGSLEEIEGTFADLLEVGLVNVQLTGGGWGYTERATLTQEGRRVLGLPVENPKLLSSLRKRSARLLLCS